MNIFNGQVALEKQFLSLARNNLLICDTMPLTIKIWCDHLFGSTPDFVTESIQKMKYDLYLLMDIDLPWEDDELRDFPHLRDHFLEVWKRELKALDANYVLISGLGEDRILRGKKL